MASIIRIKRSQVSGNPSTLAAGELAYSALTDNGSNGGERLYIGIGTETSGNAANHYVIGGTYYTGLVDASGSGGTLNTSAKSIPVLSSTGTINKWLVGNFQLVSNTLSSTNSNGDINITPNGSGKTVLSNVYIGDTSTTLAEYIQDTTGGTLTAGSGIDIAYDDGAGTSTISLNTEYTQDLIGNMISGTETDVLATYDDGTGTIDITLKTVNTNVGSFGSATAIPTFTVNGKGLITAAGTVSVATNLSIAGDTGTDTVSLLSDTLTFTGGEGIDIAVTDNTITIAGEDASTTNKGVASFDTNDFSVTSGAVSIKTAGVGNSQLENSSVTFGSTTVSLGSTSLSLAGLQQLDVDNIRIDGNEISSTDANGNISLNPNGSGSVDLNSSRITGLANPTGPQDAATKYYVDNAITGLNWKAQVHLLADSNVALTGTTNTLTIDSHTVLDSTDDGVYRLLLKGQTTSSENGIYLYTDDGSNYTLVRTTDADTYQELIGTSVYVLEGTIYGNTAWVQSNHYITSFSGQTWVQFAGAGAYTAGDGLGQTGTQFYVNVAASGGIEISADALQLKSSTAGNGLSYSSGILTVGGTSDRISVTSDNVDIASTYVGQTSIVTLGTVTTGTWNATTIATTKGGTGLTSYTTGDLLYASASNTLSALAAGAEGKVLQINASGVPVWGDVDGGTY